MKKLLSVSLTTVLFLSTFSVVTTYSPKGNDEVIAKTVVKAKYQIKNKKLYTTTKPIRLVSGYKTHNKKLYRGGYLYTGEYNKLTYVKGVKHTGLYKFYFYKNGVKGKINMDQYPFVNYVTVTAEDKALVKEAQLFYEKYMGKVTPENYLILLPQVESYIERVTATPLCDGRNELSERLYRIYYQIGIVRENVYNNTPDKPILELVELQ